MASNQIILVLFCGEIWKSLSTAIPPNVSVNKRNTYTSIRSPTEGKAPLYQLQATGPSSHKAGRALTVTTPAPFPEEEAEPSDGSWVAALLIGIILVSMLIAIMIILLWKSCKKPALADSNWAGRSPFADGDTPDLIMDSDQATKRSSILFMLPWKSKQDPNLQQDPTAPGEPAHCTTSNEKSQLPPPAEACSAASSSAAAAAEPLDLPPPPAWLTEPTGDHSSELSKYQEFHSETEQQLPPPPELLIQEIAESLPQPEHPL
ncbi:PREDICTED: protein EVI2B [Merops nubicus]|uniref:protein EVI2B n=1 Tax=Merops nubicus TaxID=57421 RepID=UPI0004F0720E|nr:PREDICTED: protein EVI2B [Merops nubicus]